MTDAPITGLIYLATPYTKYPYGTEEAFIRACQLTGRLMQLGLKVYSPIAHMHPVAIHAGINPLDHSIWLPADREMWNRTDCLMIAHMDGWDESDGIEVETDYFSEKKKPIYDLRVQPSLFWKLRRD